MDLMKKTFSVLLAACMLLCAVPALAAEIVDSGTCDKDFKNITWTLDADGVLTITGKGEMEYFPWRTRYFTRITAVKIGYGVTNIHDSAFYECNKMKTISIPNSVTRIERAALYDCKSLTSLTIPDSVTTIESSAFAHCWALQEAKLSKNLKSLPTNLFYECTSLTGATIPSGVTSIGMNAFKLCTKLTSVTIPKSVTNVESNAFNLCVSLTDVYYGGSEADWKAITVKDGNAPLTSAKIHYGQTYLPGDVDGNGKITAADARLALRKSVGLENYAKNSPKFLACDVNRDSKVTAADARLILRASVGLENPKTWR